MATVHMVVSQQMQHTVYQQARNFLLKRIAKTWRLARGGFQRNHHVAQHAQAAGIFDPHPTCFNLFNLRERQDVSGLIFAAPGFVQLVNARVIRERDGQLCLRTAQGV